MAKSFHEIVDTTREALEKLVQTSYRSFRKTKKQTAAAKAFERLEKARLRVLLIRKIVKIVESKHSGTSDRVLAAWALQTEVYNEYDDAYKAYSKHEKLVLPWDSNYLETGRISLSKLKRKN